MFHEAKSFGIVATGLEGFQGVVGLQQGYEECFSGIAGSEGEGGDTVDAGVEIIEAKANAVEEAAADNFFTDGAGGVIKEDDVIAVPADAAAEVEQEGRDIHQGGGNFVCKGFGRMEVTGVEAKDFLAADGVAEVEFVGADDIGFGADTEKFAFHGILDSICVQRLCKNLVECFLQALAWGEAVSGEVFHPIGDPEVYGAAIFLFEAEVLSDEAAGLTVADPEIPDGGIGMGEGASVGGKWMAEIAGVEVQRDLQIHGPVEPAGKMFGRIGVTIRGISAAFGVERVQVEAHGAGTEGEGCGKVPAEVIRISRFSGIVSGSGNPAALDTGFRVLQTGYIIGLPAGKGDFKRG